MTLKKDYRKLIITTIKNDYTARWTFYTGTTKEEYDTLLNYLLDALSSPIDDYGSKVLVNPPCLTKQQTFIVAENITDFTFEEIVTKAEMEDVIASEMGYDEFFIEGDDEDYHKDELCECDWCNGTYDKFFDLPYKEGDE